MIDLQNANSNDKPKLAEIGITSLKKWYLIQQMNGLSSHCI
jgi:hypothetical protein